MNTRTACLLLALARRSMLARSRSECRHQHRQAAAGHQLKDFPERRNTSRFSATLRSPACTSTASNFHRG